MSKSRATISNWGESDLHHFNDVILTKVELEQFAEVGRSWVLLAKVVLENFDGSSQWAEAKLVHANNVELEKVRVELNEEDTMCITLYSGISNLDSDTVTLVCNTYDGYAKNGRIVALSVDDIDFQP